MRFDRINVGVGLSIWLATLYVYILTMAPTLSFWDCGEFIAVSHILGIPHPPGTPLYVLMGRIFSILPFFTDISARVNFLSAFSNSFTALFGYLIAVRILRSFVPDKSTYSRLLIYGGSATGALFLAFGLTQWNNSVEAEVYGMAMMIFTAVFWLCLIHFERRGSAAADRLMLLIVYLVVLGVGVHMTSMLLLPIAALFLMLKKDTPISVWYLLAAFLFVEFFLIFALSSRPGEVPFTVPIAIVFSIFLFYALSFERIPKITVLIGAGFIVSILPLIAGAVGIRSAVITGLGIVTFALMILYSLYVLILWFMGRGKRVSWWDSSQAISATFVITAGAMSALVLIDNLHSYKPFLWISGLLFLGLVVAIWKQLRFAVVIALGAVALLIVGLKLFFAGVVLAALLLIILGLWFRLREWKVALAILFVAMAGFSVHLFIPIRAAQNPAINENNPTVSIAELIEDPSGSLQPLIGFFERKQYGNQSMIERMFVRRAEWSSQFGNYRRMGFWSFFRTQYGLEGGGFAFLLILGIFGVWETVRRRPQYGLPLAMLILLSSVGLILYMNFADGTRQLSSGADYLEVRDRDYFFTPMFVLFGLSIGLGVTGLIQFIRELSTKLSPGVRKVGLGLLTGLFLLPIAPLWGNYYHSDRSNNYVPYDYANNLLASVDPGGVLFTNGDNDTFPLWCLQQVYGIRTDVRNVNLSLSNTFWYIKQIQDNLGLDLGWTDEEIDALRPYRVRDGRIFRLQDQVVDAIVEHNHDSVAINFSVTCGTNSRKLKGRQIDSMLELSGFKFRLLKSGNGREKGVSVNVEEGLAFLLDTNIIKSRGIADPKVYKDPASLRTTSNIGASYLTLADTLRLAGRFEDAEEVLRFALVRYPHVTDIIYSLGYILSDAGKIDELSTLRDSLVGLLNVDQLTVSLARSLRRNGREDDAEQLLKMELRKRTRVRQIFDELMRLYVRQNDIPKITQGMRDWLANNPADSEIQRFLREIEARQALPHSKDSFGS